MYRGIVDFTWPPLRSRLQATGLARVADALAALAQDAIAIHRIVTDEQAIPVGGSKLGGRPDVPAHFRWPEANGIPHSFIAQINLAEAKPFAPTGLLPDAGMLYLFIDLYSMTSTNDTFWDEEIYRVENWTDRFTYYDGDVARLHRATLPRFLIDRSDADLPLHFPPCSVSFRRELTLASDYDHRVHALGLSDEESIAYGNFYWEHEVVDGAHVSRHQLFGNARYIQHSFNEPGDWYLLLQLDWDKEAQLNFGDAGVVHLWIRREDLEARNFSRMHFDLQMS